MQVATSGPERDGWLCHTEMYKQHMSTRKRGVPAQVNFPGWRKPAQLPHLSHRHQKRRFRQVVLRPDGLHHGIRQPVIQGHYSCRIPSENLPRKGIYLELLKRPQHVLSTHLGHPLKILSHPNSPDVATEPGAELRR